VGLIEPSGSAAKFTELSQQYGVHDFVRMLLWIKEAAWLKAQGIRSAAKIQKKLREDAEQPLKYFTKLLSVPEFPWDEIRDHLYWDEDSERSGPTDPTCGLRSLWSPKRPVPQKSARARRQRSDLHAVQS